MRRRLERLVVASCVGLCVSASSALAAPGATDQVLVHFEEGTPQDEIRAAARSIGAVTGEDLVAGWRVYRTKSDLTQNQVDAALAHHDVDAQVDLPVIRAALRASDPLRNAQDGLDYIGVDDMPSPGQPVTVAVLDSTINIDHPDLRNSLWLNPGETPGNGIDDDGNGMVDDVHGWSFLTDSNALSAGANDDHGTHVAGVIAAGVNNGRGIAGIAPNARIMAVPFLQDGTGTRTDAVRAFQYAIANGARVINASWSAPRPPGTDPLCAAIAEAARNGVLVVAAAGNDTVNINTNPQSPIGCPGANLIGVGASNIEASGLASFSNYGTVDVDLLAPGETVVSLGYMDDYLSMSGTSMATPHVSGAAALFLGWQPNLGPARLATNLIWHGLPNGAPGRTRSGERLHLPTALNSLNQGGIGDRIAPSAFRVKSVANTQSPRPIFSWADSDDRDSGLVGYRVRVDGRQVATTEGSVTTVEAPTDIPYGSHIWSVEAFDVANNVTRSNTALFTNVDLRGAFEMSVPEFAHSPQWVIRWRTLNPSIISNYELRANGIPFGYPRVAFGNGTFSCDASPVCEAQTRLGPTKIELIARGSSGEPVAQSATVTRIDAPTPKLADLTTNNPRPTLTWTVNGEPRAIAEILLTIGGSQVSLVPWARLYQPPVDLTVGTYAAMLRAVMQDGTVTSAGANLTILPTTAPTTAPPPRQRPLARVVAPRHGGRYLLRTTRTVVHLNAPAGATRMAVTLTAPKAKDWKRTAKRATVRLKALKGTQIIRVAFNSPSGRITRTRIKVLVDRIRPTLRLRSSARSVRLTARDTGSGVGQYQLRVGKRTGKWLSFRNGRALPAPATQVRVRDRAGNLSPWTRIR